MSGNTYKPNCKLRRKIFSRNELEEFKDSSCMKSLVTFIEALSQSVVGIKLTAEIPLSPTSSRLIDVLSTLDEWISEIPPVDQKESRFGNKAFRSWYKRLEENSRDLLSPIFRDENIREVCGYFKLSFGHPGRIDYGTGHEAHFLAFMYCTNALGYWTEENYAEMVLKVFWKYILVMRNLQTTYWLEPAGSQGVWGLDDYAFLPFLFGAAQLSDHKYLRPKSIHSSENLEMFEKDYMYFSCISFVNSIKTAPLQIYSPLLNDISGVKTWEKVRSGMVKMYKDQVLGKLPVMQHFKFGSILKFQPNNEESKKYDTIREYDEPDSDSSDDLVNDECVHFNQDGPPECCGIRIPSSAAARSAQHESMGRSIPNLDTSRKKKQTAFIPMD